MSINFAAIITQVISPMSFVAQGEFGTCLIDTRYLVLCKFALGQLDSQ